MVRLQKIKQEENIYKYILSNRFCKRAFKGVRKAGET